MKDFNIDEFEYFIKPGFKLNLNEKIVAGIRRGLVRCNGECPCANTGKTKEDRMCPCKNYRENDYCCCTLYIKETE